GDVRDGVPFTDGPCRHHHHIRTGRREIIFCELLVRKIKLAVARKQQLATRLLSETADDSGTCHPAMAGYEDALAGQIERSRRDACHSTPSTLAYAKFRWPQLQGQRRPSLLQAHRTRLYGSSRA